MTRDDEDFATATKTLLKFFGLYALGMGLIGLLVFSTA